MYKLALIQNQDKMAVASKVDIRNFVKELGYIPVLYTGANINKLKFDLKSEKIDALIFTSNCLSDLTILKEIETIDFVNALDIFLENGKGCLILQQNKVCSDGSYSFLPAPFNEIKNKRRPKDEEIVEGELTTTSILKYHSLLKYPNTIPFEEVSDKIKLNSVTEYCVEKGLLYFNYLELDNVDSLSLEELVFDSNYNYDKRAVVVSSKNNSKHRILLTTLNLDWQREPMLFQNMIAFVVEGQVPAAIIKDSKVNNIAFDFLITILKTEQYKFKEYDLNEFSHLIENDKSCLDNHSIYILGPSSIENSDYYNSVMNFFDENIEDSNIKLLSLDNSNGKYNRIMISGQEKLMLNVLYDMEIKIQREISEKGLIDGSFWNTVESLRILKKLYKKDFLHSNFGKSEYLSILEEAKKKGNIRDDNSYDSMFNPTLSLLWLIWQCYGGQDDKTIKTLTWIESRISQQDERERISAYCTLIELIKEENDHRLFEKYSLYKNNLQLLISLDDDDSDNLTEIDLIYYLRAAIVTENLELIIKYTNLLCDRCNETNGWIDISILSSIVILFLETLEVLNIREEYTKDLEDKLEHIIFFTILNIQKSKDNKATYQWQNKALTTAKCIYSILLFEDMLDLPIEDIKKTLLNYSQSVNRIDLQRNALNILEGYKREVKELKKFNDDILKEKILQEDEAKKLESEINEKNSQIDECKNSIRENSNIIKEMKNSLDESEYKLEVCDRREKFQWFIYISLVWIIIFLIMNRVRFQEFITFIYDWASYILASFTIPAVLIVGKKYRKK